MNMTTQLYIVRNFSVFETWCEPKIIQNEKYSIIQSIDATPTNHVLREHAFINNIKH